MKQSKLIEIQNEAYDYMPPFIVDSVEYCISRFDLKWLESVTPTPQVILDFGCYDCGDSIRFKKAWPNCQVYTFEGSPLRCNVARDTAKKYNINFIESAVSNVDGEIEFYEALVDSTRADQQGSIYLHSQDYKTINPRIIQQPKPIKVKSTSIGGFCAANKINSVDLMHVDVEGAELLVMKGLKDIRPKAVYVEASSGVNWLNDVTPDDLEQYLLSIGYVLGKRLPEDRLYYHSSIIE